jgi:hypothetical protein
MPEISTLHVPERRTKCHPRADAHQPNLDQVEQPAAQRGVEVVT